MSESPKMGLFGSKDDNTDTTDEKKESVKPNDTSQDRAAPYNIDSDSEAYDTEVLSIMDINDIIGIQAESAGDSTLESEIAALSEVITDIKSDDLTSGSSKVSDAKESNIGRSDSNRDIGSTKDKGSEKDSPKEDVRSQADANKSPDSATMAGINKSLQLIGEAYDSDDSQDTDTNDLPCISVPKSDNLSETVEESKNEDAEAAAKNSSQAEALAEDLVEPKQIITDECSLELKKGAASDKPVETAINPVEDDVKSIQIEKSADATDSATDVTIKQTVEENKTESMDVDSPPTQDVEDVPAEKTPCNNPEESKAPEKVAEKSTIELTAVNTENLPVQPVIEAEEPMEVDQPNEEVLDRVDTKKVDEVATEKVSDNVETEKADTIAAEKVSDNVETEKADTIAAEKVSDIVETEKADTVAAEKVSDNVETEKAVVETETISDKVEAGEANAVTTKTVPDEVTTEKADAVATKTVSDKVQTEKADATATEDAAENNPSPSDLVSEITVEVTEMIIQPEESTKLKDEILNDEKHTPKPVIREESLNDQVSKGETSISESEEIIAPENVEKDFKQSIDTPKGQEIAPEKLEMETEDSPVEESCTAKVEANSPDANIVESVAAEQSHSTIEGNKLETLADKENVETEISSENLPRVTELLSDDSMLLKCEKTVDNEPMEVDDNAEYHISESDKKSVDVSDLTDNSVDTVKPVVDVVVPLKESKSVDVATDSPVISSVMTEAAEIETALGSKLKEEDKNERIATTSILSENSAEIGESTSDIALKDSDVSKTIETSAELSKNSAGIDEPIPNITLKECVNEDTSVAPELTVNSAEIIEAVEAVTSKHATDDKLIESEVKTPAESAMMAEAMETEDIIAEKSSEKVLAVSAPDSSEKSAAVSETVVDIIPKVLPIVATEEIAVEDEKMEVDAGAKKETQKDQESNICPPDVVPDVSPDHEESLVPVVQESSTIEEKPTIKKPDNSDRIEPSGKTVENVAEISDESIDRASSEIEATKSIVETDEAKHDSRKEENLSSFATQKAESSTDKIIDILATETTDNVGPEVPQDENKEVESESKEEENVPSIVTQEPESSEKGQSSTEKIHEIETGEIADNVMEEVTEDEKKEAESGSEKEENVPAIVVEETESSSEKIHEIQTTETAENIMVQATEDEKKAVGSESKKEENVLSIDIQEPESSTDKVDEIQATESVDNVTAEVAEDEKEEIESDSEKEIKSDSKKEIESDSKTEIKSDSKKEIESDSKNEIESDSKNEIESDSKKEIESDSKNEIESDTKNEIESDSKNEIESDSKNEIESDSKKEENVSSILVQEAESSTEKIQEITAEERTEIESDSKKEENVSPILVQEAESSTEKIQEITAEERTEIESDSKKEENVSSILVQEAESSTEKIQEITAEERTEIESQTNQVEMAVSTECSESLSEKSPGAEVTKATDEPMDEDSDNKANLTKPETETAELRMDISEPSTDKIHAVGAAGTSDMSAMETVEKCDDETQLKPKEDESVLSATIENSETVTEIGEIKTLETSAAITESNIECEVNKSDAITKEAEKESSAPEENLETSAVGSEIGIAEVPKATIKDPENENDKAKTESMETSMSTDEELKKIPEVPTSTNENAMDEDSEKEIEEKETSKSESKEVEKESPISTEVSAEVPEKPEIEKSESSAEPSASTTLKNDAESHFVFSKPEALQQEAKQTDLSSSSVNLDDIEGEEDPVEEEMNLSLEPEITESQELNSRVDAGEEVQRIGELSLEGMPIDANEIDDQALDSEKNADKIPNVQDEPLHKLTVEDSVGNSSNISGIKKQEQSDERLEKPPQDDDENSKDVLSAMVPEIFHDEQSQNTQEMMDSILESDSSNFNKVLDDEEGVGAALACANNLPLEETEIDELTDKLPSESEEMLNKALDDPMSAQNIDSLEGLLDLDLIQEGDEAALKSVDPIVDKVMNEAEEADVSLLLEETDQGESVDRDDYVCAVEKSVTNEDVVPKVVEEKAKKRVRHGKIFPQAALNDPVILPVPLELETAASSSTENDAEFELPIVEPIVMEADQREPDAIEVNQLSTEESKLELAEDLLREIAVDEERKMELAGELLLEAPLVKDGQTGVPEDFLLQSAVQKESPINLPADLLLEAAVQEETKMSLPAEVLLTAAVDAGSCIDLVEEVMLESPVSEVPKLELSEDNSMERVVRDQVLTVAAEIEDLPPNSEISELESAVKFLQESEEQVIDSPLILSPKMVDSVVDEIARVEDVGIFVTDADICEDPSALVAELENIIPDPIAISEAEIISEAAKLENERKTKISEEAKLKSPIITTIEEPESTLKVIESTPPTPVVPEVSAAIAPHPETPKTHREPRETVAKSPKPEKVEQATILKKSAPIPKISILEERLKEPPKIEIPSVGEVSRTCEMPTTPKTSLLIQRDAKLSSFQKMLESPKASEKTEHKIVDTPRKDTDKHDFENVGSPRIILKIAKSAIADCGEPRSPKSPKIRSATNSPNPEDSPGQKLGKIKLKLSKSGHPSIISNENVEESCGQWHTEGTSSLSPLGMKIKFSKTGDASIVPTEKHEVTEDSKEPPKHKFEEAKRTESPIGMKIKFSRTGDASIVQQDSKESSSKHKDKLDIMQGSPKRNESPLGMKIKFSKSGDASIIQPEKSDSSEDHREISTRGKDKLDVPHDVPRRTESPLGMKFKLFKTGDASIVTSEIAEDSPPEVKKIDSPLGMKIKLSKTRGSASIVPAESSDDLKERLDVPEVPKRTESPLGMKIKLSKSGDASIIHLDDTKETVKHKERAEGSQESLQASSAGAKSEAVKVKVTKSKNAPEISGDSESVQTTPKRTESSIGMKFKLSKTGDASIVHSEKQEHVDDSKSKEKPENLQETSRKSDATIGMKIKFSKTGDASIIQSQSAKKSTEPAESEAEQKSSDTALPMKIKLQKSGDASIVDPEKKEKSAKRKETDSPLEMKIKLSKTGHPTIIACDNYPETSQRTKDIAETHKHKDSTSLREMPGMKMLKSMQPGIPGNRAELTIEPVQLQSRKSDSGNEPSPKRKDVTISPVESKKAKLEAKLSHMLPEVTIQPIMPREQKPMMFDSKASSISRQQMNVISQEISITQVRSNKAMDLSMTNKPKSLLAKNATTSANPDCEIIEHRPELIIVNENSNSSQDVMIIEEVPALRGPEAKVPKKRGRPRRNPLPLVPTKPMVDAAIPKDPLALDDIPQVLPQMASQISPKVVPLSLPPKENERPKRSCSRQKSYAPPRRGRGRGGGRGKRKMEMEHMELSKKPRIDQDLTLIEQSTTALITIDEGPTEPESSHTTSELYKALRQPPMDHKMANAMARVEAEQAVNEADLLAKDTRESLMDSRIKSHLDGVIENSMNKPSEPVIFEAERKMSLESLCSSEGQTSAPLVPEEIEKTEIIIVDEKVIEKTVEDVKDNKDTVNTQDQENWLTPSSIKLLDGRTEGNISNVQVMDEETRMSAESSSRSQTPARNMSLQAPETIVNEESQGSVLSTATTESEKVKVKNRRMEINFDPDEGPFTVDKVAEYEWPQDPTRKSETFMIQEQISHYLGVKSFKRKYPDLKRRMVDMEERNYLRENALVSEALCDMGLTAVCSSEVLDIMCNDFPDQYEEYRKYIRERQMKEHSKKQKELTAAANAEKNRIDLAEMAVQSALSWNVGLNKARRESRKCSLDLQTFTIHVPKKQQKVEEESRQSHYPVALIPGQYTDYYREYTPAELRYYPLNTVLYGPMKPNERKLDSQSEGSQSDSDSDSSSDDSSSSSSDGTQDTEESQSTMDEVDVELSRQKEDIKNIKCKMCLKHLNKFSRSEVLIQCGTCNGYVHPSCIDLTLDMVPHIQAYAWQCTDCKTCAQCHDPADEDKMLFCDMCDRGYHIYCVGLRRVPQGRWHCQECAVCASCGSREAGGANSDRNSVAQWQHEYKKGDKNTRVYVSTLCVPCSKLWRKGRYCPHCSRCHTVPQLDLEANLVHCSACDKYLHLGCVETKDLTIDRKNYLCDVCQPSRQQMVKPLVSKVFRT